LFSFFDSEYNNLSLLAVYHHSFFLIRVSGLFFSFSNPPDPSVSGKKKKKVRKERLFSSSRDYFTAPEEGVHSGREL